jgi:hypothetical protein
MPVIGADLSKIGYQLQWDIQRASEVVLRVGLCLGVVKSNTETNKGQKSL